MAATLVQSATGSSAAGASSISATLSAGATAGNLLWVAVGHDKDAGTITGPSGFTPVLAHSSTSVSIYFGYKIAAGGETTLTVTRGTTSAGSGDSMWVGEFSDAASGTWAVLTTGTNPTDESTVTSWSSGTAADPGRTCASIAAFAIDSANNSTGAETWTNSYVELTGWGATNAGIAVGWLSSTSGAQSTTHGHTGTADQVSGAVATFGKGVSVTGTLATTVSTTGGVLLGMSGTRATTVGLSGGLLLDARVTGARAITVGLSGGISVVSRAFVGQLEVEFAAGVWTDLTSRMAMRAAPLTIRHGRATEYDDVTPSVLTCSMFNDDGALMPDNTSSAYYPNVVDGKRIRWRVTKNSVTYTRFLGWIQAIRPEFPSSSTTGSVVQITATNALGLLSQRKMRSNFTEATLHRARTESVKVDCYEAIQGSTGMSATMTNYSPDQDAQQGMSATSGTISQLGVSTDDNVTIGAVVTASSTATTKFIDLIQDGQLQIIVHFKPPDDVVDASGPYYVTSFHTGAGFASSYCHLAVAPNGSNNGLYLRNAAGSSSLGLIGDIPAGRWVKVAGISRASNAARSDWKVELQDGGSSALSDVAIDVRTIHGAEYPQAIGSALRSSWGGVAALGTRTQIDYADSWTGATTRDLATRVAHVGYTCDQLPLTVSLLGSGGGAVSTGSWAGRDALEILTEMMRTADGIVWALPWGADAYGVARDLLYPSTAVATIDVDADCVGAPSLVAGVEARPTRVDATWPGGKEVATRLDAEAAGQVRSKSITTVASSATTARAAADAVLGRAWSGRSLRISRLTVSLTTGATDHTAALFSESGTLGGLFPTQRISVTVPSSHFGVSSIDSYVLGWRETYSPQDVTLEMDTIPCPVTTTVTETFTGSNGAALPAAWVAGRTEGGATAQIQGNQARLTTGAVAATSIGRRHSGQQWSDIEITGKVTFISALDSAQIWYRADPTMSTHGYYLKLQTTGTQRIRELASGDLGSFSKTITVGTQYSFRVQAAGGTHKCKVWATSGSEPGSWDLDVSPSNGALYMIGWVGIGVTTGDAVARAADFDDITVTGW